MRITKEYALECIEAAKWLYSGQYKQFKKEIVRFPQHQKRKPIIHFKDDVREVFKRPPAIYSNQRPYDFSEQ